MLTFFSSKLNKTHFTSLIWTPNFIISQNCFSLKNLLKKLQWAPSVSHYLHLISKYTNNFSSLLKEKLNQFDLIFIPNIANCHLLHCIAISHSLLFRTSLAYNLLLVELFDNLPLFNNLYRRRWFYCLHMWTLEL